VSKSKGHLLHICRGLDLAILDYVRERRDEMVKQIISLLRRKKGGKQIAGTKRAVEEGLQIVSDCHRSCIERCMGIPVYLYFSDEGLEALKELYGCGVELTDEIEAICRSVSIENFARGRKDPKLFVVEMHGVGMVGVWSDMVYFYQGAVKVVEQLHRPLGSDHAVGAAAEVMVEHAKSIRPGTW